MTGMTLLFSSLQFRKLHFIIYLQGCAQIFSLLSVARILLYLKSAYVHGLHKGVVFVTDLTHLALLVGDGIFGPGE